MDGVLSDTASMPKSFHHKIVFPDKGGKISALVGNRTSYEEGEVGLGHSPRRK